MAKRSALLDISLKPFPERVSSREAVSSEASRRVPLQTIGRVSESKLQEASSNANTHERESGDRLPGILPGFVHARASAGRKEITGFGRFPNWRRAEWRLFEQLSGRDRLSQFWSEFPRENTKGYACE